MIQIKFTPLSAKTVSPSVNLPIMKVEGGKWREM
jgi:hypothetical protein